MMLMVDPADTHGRAVEEEEREVIISCENVHKTYLLGVEGIPALRGISLDIHKGEFVVIYGTSGGGKTSLLNILGTIDTPTKGNLQINGRRVTSRTVDKDLALLRLQSIGFVFQTFNLLSTLTALENVEMPMVLLGELSPERRRARAKELLESVGMGPRMNHLPSMLSGGEQQRVTIARSIANRPAILLLDEPTGDLDTNNTNIVMDMLVRLNEQEGITMVMVTHDVNLKNFAHRAVYIRDGRLWRNEPIPAAARQLKVDHLRAALRNVQEQGNRTLAFATEAAPVRAPSASSGENPLTAPAPAAANGQPGQGQGLSHVRRPQDYRTYVPTNQRAARYERVAERDARDRLYAQLFNVLPQAPPPEGPSPDPRTPGTASRPHSADTGVVAHGVAIEMVQLASGASGVPAAVSVTGTDVPGRSLVLEEESVASREPAAFARHSSTMPLLVQAAEAEGPVGK